MDRFSKVLVLAPHSDDTELGVGGLLSRIRGFGDVRVIIVAVGDINFDHVGLVRRETRIQEARAGLNRLGVDDFEILTDFESTLPSKMEHRQLISILDDRIKKFQPSAFFIPLPSYHQDHRFTFECGFAAVRPNPNMRDIKLVGVYEYPMNCLDTEIPFNSKVYVDITKHIDSKIAAYECHVSQIDRDALHLLSPYSVRELARQRGREIGLEYAERFYLLREVI